jgi:hypothetical protein
MRQATFPVDLQGDQVRLLSARVGSKSATRAGQGRWVPAPAAPGAVPGQHRERAGRDPVLGCGVAGAVQGPRGLPDVFEHVDEVQDFFGWYNNGHRHGGLGLHTAADVHHGHAPAVRAARARRTRNGPGQLIRWQSSQALIAPKSASR